MLAAFRLGSRRCPRISGHRTGVGTRRQSRIRSLGPAARWCSSVTAGHARCSRPSGWPSAARSRRTCLLMETFRLPRGLAAAGSTCCERHRRRWPTSSRPCSLPAEASPPGATRICARRSPTNDCARELWRRSVRSRASSGRRPCPRSPAGRTRPVVISNSVPTMRRPPLARGTRDGDTATSAVDTSRCSCAPPPSPTRSSGYGFDTTARPLALVLAPRPRLGAETVGICPSRAASPGCLGRG
jgi:hypothetical protein